MTIEELRKKLRNILPHTMQVEKDFYDDTIVIRTNLVEGEDGDLMSEDGELLGDSGELLEAEP